MSLKSLREALCKQQADSKDWPPRIHIAVSMLIAMIDYYRPLGSNGKHGNLHTTYCGCEDK